MRRRYWLVAVIAVVVVGCVIVGVTGVKISSVHERTIAAPASKIGALLDTLASNDDRFWPHENWSAVKFDKPLQVGATGGHGTGPYTITSYTPGKYIRFEFGGGRSGYHEFEVQPVNETSTVLRHTLKAQLPFFAIHRWYFHIRLLHDGLLEDLLDKVEGQVSRVAQPQVWSAQLVKQREARGLPAAKRDIAMQR